jgi:methylmalonyl-CoA mutase cobalamin-binding subunit
MARESIVKKFTDLGFDRVFLAADDLEDAASCLRSDIEQRKRRLQECGRS